MNSVELNFDGLVGPTHNYSGLSHGNLASEQNARSISNPKEAVKQGLRKMKTLLEMGIPQGVLPPHERPAVDVLRRLGFSGTEETVIRTASQVAPRVFAACCSASSMWAANAATVSPSADTQDKRVHLTPANLCGQFHRSIETATTAKVLRAIFSGGDYFVHHSPLPCSTLFGDEGAANHTRFCAAYEDPGVELFVYGRGALESTGARPRRYPARQTLEASQALSRLHGLDPEKTVFAQQQPEAIDAGVFHNDVIAVGNQNVLLYHENAFVDTRRVCDEIRRKFGEERLYLIEVGREQISLDEAVKSYLFNSQLVSLPERGMAVLVPAECRSSATVWNYLQELVSEENPICEIKVLDLKQSVRNGGGPACLRLRVVLDEDELWGVNQRVILSQELLEILEAWADRHYRDRLVVQDLADTQLLEESRQALDELTQVLGLGSVYPFQVGGLET